ncbi:DUF502 domain-containing protein [Paracoccus stylophorae]|uniref:DUF502 domain-containing protein n=1 Tax=Paracoccus stylophorae TaxID=659350 RepID=A0ABY7SR31_9RHOB|nr:DUF502 domain-containing protein [Paracoccus stylophorae]WCR09433.1 DUF502 domain-containing protein [Paracoccus stylophorae]
MRPPDPRPLQRTPRRPRLLVRMRANFLAGLVVVAPIGITVWLIWTLTGWMDSWVLPLIPARWRPEQYIGINLRGVGVVFFLLFTVVIGWAAKGWVGRSLLRTGETLVNRMPIVRSIYGALKQIAETILSQSEARFDRACLIEYPRKGLWAVGFVTAPAKGELPQVAGEPLLAVFVPTTPNPTSGFLIYAPARAVKVLDMSVEDAAKLVISAGLVYPTTPEPRNSSDRSTVS